MLPEIDLTPALSGLSSVCGKPVMVRFDGGHLSSDGGVLLPAKVERRIAVADRLVFDIGDIEGKSPWRAAAIVVRASRQPLLHAGSHLRGDHQNAKIKNLLSFKVQREGDPG
jgi:hypothetical protein